MSTTKQGCLLILAKEASWLHNFNAEHGVVIWNSGLTKGQVNHLEKIQKMALEIILDESYISYDVACTSLNVVHLNYKTINYNKLIEQNTKGREMKSTQRQDLNEID